MCAIFPTASLRVALLAEGVDRNTAPAASTAVFTVALLAEGVDRNGDDKTVIGYKVGRPPRGGRG